LKGGVLIKISFNYELPGKGEKVRVLMLRPRKHVKQEV